MPPPLRICALRPRTLRSSNAVIGIKRPAYRNYADENDHSKLQKARVGETGPNTQQQEHVSEEAAKMAKIQGGSGPDMDAGTPIQEIMAEEKDTREDAPEVLQQQVNKTNKTTQPSTDPGYHPSGKRSFSTFTRRRLEMQLNSPSPSATLPPSMLPTSTPPTSASASAPTTGIQTGHKFPLPAINTIPRLKERMTSTPGGNHRKSLRSEPIIEQLVGLIQVDGQKSVAQRNMAHILNYLRTAPAPTYSPTRQLLPGAPAASHLPLNPTMYLTLAIDSVAPLLRIRSQRGAAGGGVALQIPVPLGKRQRRRQAFTWILDAASKRQNRGSGKEMFAQRVAQEIVSVVEGKSGVWEKRQAVHRLATAGRQNLNFGRVGFRR